MVAQREMHFWNYLDAECVKTHHDSYGNTNTSCLICIVWKCRKVHLYRGHPVSHCHVCICGCTKKIFDNCLMTET